MCFRLGEGGCLTIVLAAPRAFQKLLTIVPEALIVKAMNTKR